MANRVKKAGAVLSGDGPGVEFGSKDRASFLMLLTGEGSAGATIFREMFDEWCSTGFVAGREELPRSRNIWQTDKAIRTCDEFLEKHPPQFRLGNGGHRYVRPGLNYEESLSKFVSGAHDPRTARLAGIREFIDFLNEPWCFQFAKCRECGRYFDMGRAPKESYAYGVHCTEARCQRAQASKAALDATQKARFLGKVERLTLAAKTLASWGEPAVQPDSDAILQKAKKTSPREVKRLGLTAHFISRHRAEIERYARGSYESSSN